MPRGSPQLRLRPKPEKFMEKICYALGLDDFMPRPNLKLVLVYNSILDSRRNGASAAGS